MSADPDAGTGNRADPTHAARIAELVTARSTVGATTIVAIDGPAGSGKSSLAALVSQRLDDSTVVHMDDLYAGWDGLAAAPALLTAQVLVPLSRREPASFRQFDWATNEFADRVGVPAAACLIVEGCGSAVGIARPYAAVRVWLEADHDVRMRRGLDRDGEIFAPHWDHWARQESAMYTADQTRTHAHLQFRTD